MWLKSFTRQLGDVLSFRTETATYSIFSLCFIDLLLSFCLSKTECFKAQFML